MSEITQTEERLPNTSCHISYMTVFIVVLFKRQMEILVYLDSMIQGFNITLPSEHLGFRSHGSIIIDGGGGQYDSIVAGSKLRFEQIWPPF